MAFDDILGDEKESDDQTIESIMEAMKENINAKDKLITDLVSKVTELEKELEDLKQQ